MLQLLVYGARRRHELSGVGGGYDEIKRKKNRKEKNTTAQQRDKEKIKEKQKKVNTFRSWENL